MYEIITADIILDHKYKTIGKLSFNTIDAKNPKTTTDNISIEIKFNIKFPYSNIFKKTINKQTKKNIGCNFLKYKKKFKLNKKKLNKKLTKLYL